MSATIIGQLSVVLMAGFDSMIYSFKRSVREIEAVITTQVTRGAKLSTLDRNVALHRGIFNRRVHLC